MDRIRDERLDVLDGSRGRAALPQAAVRIANLAPLLNIPATLESLPAAGDPPTQAEFDALQRDVVTLHQQLLAISDTLRQRLIP